MCVITTRYKSYSSFFLSFIELPIILWSPISWIHSVWCSLRFCSFLLMNYFLFKHIPQSFAPRPLHSWYGRTGWGGTCEVRACVCSVNGTKFASLTIVLIPCLLRSWLWLVAMVGCYGWLLRLVGCYMVHYGGPHCLAFFQTFLQLTPQKKIWKKCAKTNWVKLSSTQF